MARSNPCYYIAPTAVSVTPNANDSASDLAVHITKGTKIKVFSYGVSGLGYTDTAWQQWTLSGRNRRLSDPNKPYTIYARLQKNNKDYGYLIFAPKVADGDKWLDKYAYITIDGLATGTANKNSNDYWYVKLGEVSLSENGKRTVTLDTGILGTDQFNTDWNLNPDNMPLRVELSATIDGVDAGDKPYVPWGKELILRAKLLQGWANTDVQRFHHWTIQRNTGNSDADLPWNFPYSTSNTKTPSSGRLVPNGNIALSHARGEGDMFGGAVSSIWTVTAWGLPQLKESDFNSDSSSASSSATDTTVYEKLAEGTINILAETVEQFAIELSTGMVNYDPSSDTYNPIGGVDVMVRATDQKGDVFKMTNAQLKAASLGVQYSVATLDQWNICTFKGTDDEVAKTNIPIEAFHLQQNVNVRIVKITVTKVESASSSASSSAGEASNKTVETYQELCRTPIAFVRNGEDSKEREWIFLRSETAISFSYDIKDTSKPLIPSLIAGGEVKPEEAATGDDTNKNQDGWVPQGWWDEMQDTDSKYHYEYAAYRDYIKSSDIESASSSAPSKDASSSDSAKGASSSDSPSDSSKGASPSANATQRRGHWGDFSTPRIWSYFAEDAVSYRCRWTLAGVEVYQLKCAYTGAFRGTLPLVATLMKRVGSGGEQEVSGESVIVVSCDGIDFSKTLNASSPSFTIAADNADTKDFIQYLNNVALNALAVSFNVNGEVHNFSIPVIREADKDSVESTIDDYGSKKFLSKEHDDETKHTLTMGGAVVNGEAVIKDRARSDDFDNHKGFPFGKGWAAVKDDGSGASTLEVDKLFVRMKAYFAELEIRKISYLGGNYVFSSGGGKIYYVEWLDANGKILEQTEDNKSLVYTFRCYLYSDDGTTQTVNWFQVDDQVRCQNFGDLTKSKTAKAANGVITDADHTTHYWWRRVSAVGNGAIAAKGDNKAYQYIEFQNKAGQYGADSDFPEIGDAMVQFGNWTTASRQGVIMIVVTGDDAPAIIEWQDVGANYKHFVMPDNEYTRLSPRGDGNIIRGKFISEYGTTTDNKGKSVDEQIDALMDQLNDIKNQADKKFDIWFGGGEPHPNSATDTEVNAPASDWKTDAEKGLHVQDLYYDTDKTPASKGGRAWRWMAHNANSTVVYYWEEVTDKDTIDALEKAADLQNQVDDIVSDGIISHGSEKSSLLVEWNTACSNYNKYNEQVIDYSLQDEDVWKNFSKAFFDVATMLNNGADYTYPNVPVWISSDGITKDTALADTPCHTAAEYRSKWNTYYETLAALLAAITKKAKELADSAQSTADEQKGRIDDIISDGKLDPSEKITIKREFLAFYHELYDDKGLEDKGKNEDGDFYTDEINNSFNSVVNSLGAVGTMLNNAVDWPVPNPSLIDKKLPIWLQNPPLPTSATDKNEYITDTSSIDADTFRSKWSAMYAAKSAYISLLSEYAKSLADNAQTTANGKANVFVSDSVPSQPYKRGDLWIQTANGNNVMICTVTRTGTGAGILSDWEDLSDTYDFKGIRTLLASLAEKIYDISGGYIESRGKINVYLYKDGAEMKDGNIRFDGNGVARCSSNTWTKIDNAGYTDAFTCVYGVLGSSMLTVYSSKPSNASKYDLVIRKVTWHDPWQDKDVEGNIEILMYNGSSWEMLRESTKAIIENLGDEIRTVVFGSDNKGATDASGLVTRTMFSELFSQKVKDDKVVSESTISTWLGENDYLTGASIKSWATDEAGFVKSATLDAYVKKVSNGDGTYSLESDIDISADRINFIGKTIINNKFWVDTDGVVYMDEAHVSGTVVANLLYGRTKEVVFSSSMLEYNIDPKKEPATMFFVNEPFNYNGLSFKLPKAADYDGLEISIFCKKVLPDTRESFNSHYVFVKCSETTDHFYVKQNAVHALLCGASSLNDTNMTATVEERSINYTDFIGSSVRIQMNDLVKFKSIGGAWFAIAGLFTGE